MNWIGLSFALFVLFAWLVFVCLPAGLRRYWILLCSLFFFVLEGPAPLAWVLALSGWTWAFGRIVGKSQATRPALTAGIGGLIAALAVGKYMTWFSGVLGLGSGIFSNRPDWLAPLGMSYFIFRMISYLADVGASKIRPAGLSAIAGYVLFFPTLPAGPIERFGDFAPQALSGKSPEYRDLGHGLWRIASGVFKSIVLSDFLFEVATLMRRSDSIPTAWLWMAMYSYCFYIYMNFSGYSDMAVGIARLFGIRIRENFDWPYLRTNIADFWRCWHMSLTAFITQYIYYPLGGNRKGQIRAGINSMIAMGLCGMWHGAGWHFIAWGLYHGAGLTLYRTWRNLRKARGPRHSESKTGRFLAWFVTFQFVAFGWVLFFLPLKEAVAFFLALFGIRGGLR